MVSAPALNSQVLLACFQNACGTPVDNLWSRDFKGKLRLWVEVGVVGSGIPQQPRLCHLLPYMLDFGVRFSARMCLC